jgi:hypothetical protein
VRIITVTLQEIKNTVVQDPSNEEGLLYVKEGTVLLERVAVVCALLRLNEQLVAQFKILSHNFLGKFGKNHQRCDRIAS